MSRFNARFRAIGRRLPSRRELLQVFGVVLFAVFGWSIRGFLYKLPSFTLYFGLTANLAILSYMFAFALAECVLVTGVLFVLSALLPPRFLTQGFSYKCFIILVVATTAMIVFGGYYKADFFKDILNGDDSSIPPIIWGAVVSLVALIGLFWLFRVKPRLQAYVVYAVEQLSLFTYIYVPLGLIGLIVVIIRNIP